jgi:hypothetical protein
MPLLFSPVYSPTRLLQLQSFFIIQNLVGRCPSPTLWWSMPHVSHCCKPSPLQAHWGRWCHSCLLWLACLFTVWVGSASPPLSGTQGTPPSLLYVFFSFFSCLFIIQVFFSFFPGRGSICPGGYADLSQGVLCAPYLLIWWSPKQVRSWCLAGWEPSWFLHLTWSRDAMCGLGVWRCRSFASSWWFLLPGVSPASLQEFTLGSTLSACSHFYIFLLPYDSG